MDKYHKASAEFDQVLLYRQIDGGPIEQISANHEAWLKLDEDQVLEPVTPLVRIERDEAEDILRDLHIDIYVLENGKPNYSGPLFEDPSRSKAEVWSPRF